jgi:sialate O-acetylesterase
MRDNWLVAEEPLHTRVDAADRVYWFLNAQKTPEAWTGTRLERYNRERDRGTGLGLPFALEMLRRTGVPVGLVPCALGGTNMDQWSPSLKDQGGDSLYGATIRRARAAGGKLKGVVWYQGESDATERRAPLFQAKFEAFVAALREDLGAPGLPFYYVQIGRNINTQNIGDYWNTVQEAQRTAEAKISHSGMVAAVDLSLVDLAHADAVSLNRLGVRVANLACRDLFPEVAACSKLKSGPRPLAAVVKDFPYHSVLTVTFGGVNGCLRAEGRMAGFSIHDTANAPLPIIYSVEPDPANPNAVLVKLTGKVPQGGVLRYGYRTDPYCNLADEAGMAVPAFGPMAIAQGGPAGREGPTRGGARAGAGHWPRPRRETLPAWRPIAACGRSSERYFPGGPPAWRGGPSRRPPAASGGCARTPRSGARARGWRPERSTAGAPCARLRDRSRNRPGRRTARRWRRKRPCRWACPLRRARCNSACPACARPGRVRLG